MNENTREQAMKALRAIKDTVIDMCNLTDDDDQKNRFALVTSRAIEEFAAAYGENYYNVYDEMMHPEDYLEAKEANR